MVHFSHQEAEEFIKLYFLYDGVLDLVVFTMAETRQVGERCVESS